MNSFGPDKPLIFVILALTLIGLVMVYSSSYQIAIETTRAHDSSFFLRNHLLRVILGLILMYVFTKVGEGPLRTLARPLMALSIKSNRFSFQPKRSVITKPKTMMPQKTR